MLTQKDTIMNKTEEIKFRVTQEEKHEICQKAKSCGMKTSEYARMVLFSHKVTINVEEENK